MLSKVAGLAAPLQLKAAVDALGAGGSDGRAAALRAIALFSASRLISALAREAKGPLFTPVAQAAARSVSYGAFSHVLSLDPAFHLSRRPGRKPSAPAPSAIRRTR
jgi:ABC transporter ATM